MSAAGNPWDDSREDVTRSPMPTRGTSIARDVIDLTAANSASQMSRGQGATANELEPRRSTASASMPDAALPHRDPVEIHGGHGPQPAEMGDDWQNALNTARVHEITCPACNSPRVMDRQRARYMNSNPGDSRADYDNEGS
jgi:hypothetical protein